MGTHIEQPLKTLKEQVLEYVELKTELMRLTLVEYAANLVSYIFAAVVGLLLIALIFLSLFIALSFFMGRWVHSYGLGFLISTAIYLLLLWFFAVAGRKKVQRYIMRKIIEQTTISSKNK